MASHVWPAWGATTRDRTPIRTNYSKRSQMTLDGLCFGVWGQTVYNMGRSWANQRRY